MTEMDWMSDPLDDFPEGGARDATATIPRPQTKKQPLQEWDEDTLVLGIETSCDETSAAVVKGGRTILSNIIVSQTELHGEYGGIVPEIAARSHVEALTPAIGEALLRADATFWNLKVEDFALSWHPHSARILFWCPVGAILI